MINLRHSSIPARQIALTPPEPKGRSISGTMGVFIKRGTFT